MTASTYWAMNMSGIVYILLLLQKSAKIKISTPVGHIILSTYNRVFTYHIVTNFIQLVSPQPVDWFSQTKLRWKAPNEGYPHICGMSKSNNKWLRYQTISSCKSFVCKYLMNGWTDLHGWTCVGKCSSICLQRYMMCLKAISISRDTSISM